MQRWQLKICQKEKPFMKKLYITAISFFVLSAIYGQKNEYSLNLNSGLFSFGGSSADRKSVV
jgi:hypothetical protein